LGLAGFTCACAQVKAAITKTTASSERIRPSPMMSQPDTEAYRMAEGAGSPRHFPGWQKRRKFVPLMPDAPRWMFEVKHDGYRFMPEPAALDGEGVVVVKRGVIDFAQLRSALAGRGESRAVFLSVFDLIELKGHRPRPQDGLKRSLRPTLRPQRTSHRSPEKYLQQNPCAVPLPDGERANCASVPRGRKYCSKSIDVKVDVSSARPCAWAVLGLDQRSRTRTRRAATRHHRVIMG